jgi:drug/metabolite transporter (DMT)-like permease
MIFVSVLAFTSFSPLDSPWPGIAGSIYIGIFEMGATFFVWLKALEYAENQAPVANLIYLSPFISLVFIHLVLGEKILATTIIGLFLILLGIIIQKK